MSLHLKSALKPFIPASVLEQWRRYRFNVEQAAVRGRPLEDVFNEIYDRGTWRPDGEDARYHSGPGSMAGVTAGYESFVAKVITDDPSIGHLVDIGCGDFQVSQRILQRLTRPVRYTGCDIASLVVAHNAKVHGVPGHIEFQHVNVARDSLPHGDIVTIREVFQHLSNETILAALANLRTVFKRAIITEAIPSTACQPNLDIASGYRTRDGLNSGVFLELAPFNLTVLDRYELNAREDSVLRTLVVAL